MGAMSSRGPGGSLIGLGAPLTWNPMRIGAVVLLVWLVSIATLAAVDLDLDAAGRFVLAFCVVGTSSMLALVVLRARRWILTSVGWLLRASLSSMDEVAAILSVPRRSAQRQLAHAAPDPGARPV